MAFRRTAASAAELLVELRSFAAARGPALPLPPNLPLDAARVCSGEKELLSPDTPFTFKCTGCGACCRAYAPSVLLDSRDVTLLALPGRGDVSALHPHHFTRRVGGFALSSLSSASVEHCVGGRLLGLPLTRASGTAPVLFLRSRGRGASARCSFSRASGGGGLQCSLGKAGMPLACALYPLGSFLPAAPGVGPALFSLDDAGSCEGVGAAAAGAQAQTAQAYLSHAGLPPRLDSAAWFQQLATAWACSGVEEALAALGAQAMPPRAWLPAGAPAPSAAAQAQGAGAPNPLLAALRGRVRELWYSPARVWEEGTEEVIAEETRALYREASLLL